MTDCCRCGRSDDDGATLVRVLDQDVLCIVCADAIMEAGTETREVEQAGLDEYA